MGPSLAAGRILPDHPRLGLLKTSALGVLDPKTPATTLEPNVAIGGEPQLIEGTVSVAC